MGKENGSSVLSNMPGKAKPPPGFSASETPGQAGHQREAVVAVDHRAVLHVVR